MSWLFGYGKNREQGPDLAQMGLGVPTGAGGGGSNDGPKEPNLTSAERKAMEAYRFDSTALERAAQAARELEKSSKETLIRLCNISAYPHLTFLYFSSGH